VKRTPSSVAVYVAIERFSGYERGAYESDTNAAAAACPVLANVNVISKVAEMYARRLTPTPEGTLIDQFTPEE